MQKDSPPAPIYGSASPSASRRSSTSGASAASPAGVGGRGSPLRSEHEQIEFAGILSNMASEVGYVLLVPLGAIIFLSVGRHPIAGLAAAFAGVSGGFSANLLLGTIDPLLAGISQEAARIIDARTGDSLLLVTDVDQSPEQLPGGDLQLSDNAIHEPEALPLPPAEIIADEIDRRLTVARMREMEVDLIISCGDLPFEYLEFVMGAVNKPLYFVPGNHDPEVTKKRDPFAIGGFAGGGFIFNTGHFVQPDTPPQRLVRAYTVANELAERYGA